MPHWGNALLVQVDSGTGGYSLGLVLRLDFTEFAHSSAQGTAIAPLSGGVRKELQ